MNLSFEVTNQFIRRTDKNTVVADSKNYLYATFTFSDEWQGIKTAIFKHGGEKYHVLLENDMCLVPWEVIKQGILDVSVFCGDLITASTAHITINKSGYSDGGAPSEPTPDIYSQIISMINEIETGGIPDDKIAEAVEKYLSEHPVETLTEEDVQRIVSEYVAAHKEELKGEKGDPGVDGAPGKDGTNGADGRDGLDGIPGASAYEIAVAHGFTGTEEEWLASLKGDKGDPGENGQDGTNGKDLVHQGEQIESSEYQLKPNTFCLFTAAVSNLTITLPEIYNFYDEFNFGFTTASEGCNLSIPSNIVWLYEAPTLEADKYYECSIMNGKAVISQ